MFVILPFEKDFYKQFQYEVDFVGHPLLDAIKNKNQESRINSQESNSGDFLKKYALSDKPIVALLPGSRKQEIKTMLPVMIKLQEQFPNYQFIVAGAPSTGVDFYNGFLKKSKIKIIFNETYELLQQATAAMVTSGTATLETALFGVPEVVCYKGGAVSFFIARQLVKVKFISLVNIIMDKEIVKELIQNNFNEQNLTLELNKLLNDKSYRSEVLSNFALLQQKLGGSGASKKTAELMIRYLRVSD